MYAVQGELVSLSPSDDEDEPEAKVAEVDDVEVSRRGRIVVPVDFPPK
jgi:hypothetical protein